MMSEAGSSGKRGGERPDNVRERDGDSMGR